jgi:SAM-dependent methyltransferase
MDLKEKLDIAGRILRGCDDHIYNHLTGDEKRKRYKTGFVLTAVNGVRDTLLNLEHSKNLKSLDLGCGTGAWTIMASVAGYKSYGIEINPYLIEEAIRNRELAISEGVLNKDSICKFAVGNMFPENWHEKYTEVRPKYRGLDAVDYMPIGNGEMPYQDLQISLKYIDIIYTYPWGHWFNILFDFLHEESSNPTFVFPNIEFNHLPQNIREKWTETTNGENSFYTFKKL